MWKSNFNNSFVLSTSKVLLECQDLCLLKKRFWECKSLLERSGNPAKWGFCDFFERKKPHRQAGALQFFQNLHVGFIGFP